MVASAPVPNWMPWSSKPMIGLLELLPSFVENESAPGVTINEPELELSDVACRVAMLDCDNTPVVQRAEGVHSMELLPKVAKASALLASDREALQAVIVVASENVSEPLHEV